MPALDPSSQQHQQMTPGASLRRRAPSVLALALLTAFACSKPSDRLAVSGQVMLNGAPLDSGSIRFTSQGEGRLVASGAMIQGGIYSIPQAKGLLPGTYQVEIYSPDNSAPPVMIRQAPGGPGIPVAPERIPPEYNSASNKTIEVSREGNNQFDFNIASQRGK
ncbi:MAG: hypothetical protein IT424_09240 [Pirellulales bacterium]|nr:hypothetical protein [Pirellulales bacterium]